MSGGSFNYLCFKSASDLFASMCDLEEMAAELGGLGHQARDVASRTRSLIALRDHIDNEIQALSDVWQAVEWWRSCDRGRDDVFVALGKYKARQECRSTEAAA